MDTIYNANDQFMEKLSPSRFKLKKGIDKIFPIPVKNSVGTNSLKNSIIFINFEKPELQYKKFFKDPDSNPGSGIFIFMPVISERTFGFARKRLFDLFNIPNNSFIEYWVCKDILEHITQVEIVDPEKLIFAFGITKYIEDRVKPTIEKNLIRIYDLSSDEPQLVATHTISVDDMWVQSNKNFFIFNENEIYALDLNFNKISHPLVDFFEKKRKEHKDKEIPQVKDIAFHPTLPFAIIKEYGKNVSVITWNNETPQYFPLLRGSRIDRFSFSPDGKWFLFFASSPKPIKLLVTPVTDKKPYYLGKPILLAKSHVVPYERIIAWVNEPTSYVILGKDTLLVWDLSTVKIE
ncbi:MAG: hypothetical protein HF982_09460 [Desulfobacteraceae bacterium]|nr:hypothetical protein [Desulfobacteraceae bacterium]MBC2719794.1 hypothetical protein [Desulfobacteraceae bacterium]